MGAGFEGSEEEISATGSWSRPGPVQSGAAGEEAAEEVEEVLGVGAPGVVVVSVAGEEVGEEVEEVLGVEGARAVPVAGALGDVDAAEDGDVVEVPAGIGDRPVGRAHAEADLDAGAVGADAGDVVVLERPGGLGDGGSGVVPDGGPGGPVVARLDVGVVVDRGVNAEPAAELEVDIDVPGEVHGRGGGVDGAWEDAVLVVAGEVVADDVLP